MKGIAVVVLICLSFVSMAQVANPPTLTMTEKVALQTLFDKQKTLQEQAKAVIEALRAVEADIVKAHPGYHLNQQTGQLEKDLPPTPAPDKK